MCDVVFSQCMKGGRRPKLSRFRCTSAALLPMAVECDGAHDHLPFDTYKVGRKWKFSTASEAEYPLQLCREFVHLLASNLAIPVNLQPPSGARPPIPQPRRAPRLISEFMGFSSEPPSDGRPFKELPSWDRGSFGRFGLFRFPLEFVDCALQLKHPFDEIHFVPDQVKRNIFRMLTQGHAAFALQRLSLVKRLKTLRKELQYEEARFHATLPDHVREVIKGKSIMLWAHLLKETNFEDQAVVELMKGVDLVGTPDKSPLYDSKHVPASTTAELLLESSEWRRQRLKAKNPHEGDANFSELLWEQTMADVDGGFLAGPFESEEAVKKHLGVERFVSSRRFLIEQGSSDRKKYRAIDDYRQGGVNEAYSALEKLALFDVSYMTAMAIYISKVADPSGPVQVCLSSGEVLAAPLHDDFKAHVCWKGRTLDLAKAYRQVPLAESSLPFGVVMVTDPSDRLVKYFAAQSLPFGATSSVFAFNRISRSLLHLAWHLCGLVAGAFYDDYPIMEPAPSAGMASLSFEALLDELGWRYSDDTDKALPFSEDFDLLGVRMSLGCVMTGVVKLQNKPSRLEKRKDAFVKIGLKGEVSLHELQSLQGQVNFAVGFAAGRGLKLLQRAISNMISRYDSILPSELLELSEWAIRLIEACTPRTFACRGPSQPVCIFTDAAFEDGVGTYGIVAFDPASGARLVCGGTIPPYLVDHWRVDSPKQAIAQCEAFAVVLSRYVLSSWVTSRRCIFFVDNEGAREVLIKGSSRSRTLLSISALFFELEDRDHAITWLERVPSDSNVADAPSRGLVSETARLINGRILDATAHVAYLADRCTSVSQLPWKLLA